MKKILFLSAFPPSTTGAGQKYTNNLINDLRNHYVVDLFFFDNKYCKCEIMYSGRFKNPFFIKFLRCLQFPFLHPFFTARFSFRVLFKIRSMANQYDALYFDFSQVFIYALFVHHKNKFLMAHDIIFQRYLRRRNLVSLIEKMWVRLSERFILKKAKSTVVVFSKKDAGILKEYYALKEPWVVDFYLSEEIRLAIPDKTDEYFCFFASWNRPENLESLSWFMDNVFPRLSKESKFVIIGPYLPEKIIMALRRNSNINYVGFIDNPYLVISKAKALIAPLFKGGGVKVKCLESLLCGIPIIGTNVALEGIDDRLIAHCIIAHTASDYVASITAFNDQQYDRLAWKKQVGNLYPNSLFVNHLQKMFAGAI